VAQAISFYQAKQSRVEVDAIMNVFFQRIFSSIAAKLFFWFWLIAIVSVFTTHIISTQLSDSNFVKDNLIKQSDVLPAFRGDMRQLHKLINYNSYHRNDSLKTFLKKQNKNRTKGKTIWLKNSVSNKLFSSKNKVDNVIESYLLENNFKQNNLKKPSTVQFTKVRLTGPLIITINEVDYQLFISSRVKHPPPFLFVPMWLRITLPVVISFILLWFLAKYSSKPLLTIQQAANKFGNGELNTRVEKLDQRNDELGQLAKSFNQMAEKLEGSISAQQRLLADVSHELRSPMTRLQLAIALAHKSSESKVDLEKYLLRCETEVGRLDNMLGNVIALSRLENTLPNFSSTPIQLSNLLHDLINDAQFLADEKSIKIHFSTQNCINLNGDEQLLASAFSNIHSNAVKYSSDNSEIGVSLKTDKQWITIEISDSGTGVPEEALSQLFKPFYRVQNDRARTTGGSGLGLAIAKQAILAHHGEINAFNNEPKGFTVEIKLPKA